MDKLPLDISFMLFQSLPLVTLTKLRRTCRVFENALHEWSTKDFETWFQLAWRNEVAAANILYALDLSAPKPRWNRMEPGVNLKTLAKTSATGFAESSTVSDCKGLVCFMGLSFDTPLFVSFTALYFSLLRIIIDRLDFVSPGAPPSNLSQYISRILDAFNGSIDTPKVKHIEIRLRRQRPRDQTVEALNQPHYSLVIRYSTNKSTRIRTIIKHKWLSLDNLKRVLYSFQQNQHPFEKMMSSDANKLCVHHNYVREEDTRAFEFGDLLCITFLSKPERRVYTEEENEEWWRKQW